MRLKRNTNQIHMEIILMMIMALYPKITMID